MMPSVHLASDTCDWARWAKADVLTRGIEKQGMREFGAYKSKLCTLKNRHFITGRGVSITALYAHIHFAVLAFLNPNSPALQCTLALLALARDFGPGRDLSCAANFGAARMPEADARLDRMRQKQGTSGI